MKNSKIYPWVVVALLWGVALLNYMDRQMLSTMKDAMQMDITELQSATNFGRLMAVFLSEMVNCRKSVRVVSCNLLNGYSRYIPANILAQSPDGSK